MAAPLRIDARGHKCPVPTLKLRRALETATRPTLIELWADDPMAQIDIPHFCLKNNLPEPQIETDPAAFWRFVIHAPESP